MSDRFGGRRVMYWVLGASVLLSLLLIVPKMEITSPGKGVIADRDGTVTNVTENSITVGEKTYPVKARVAIGSEKQDEGLDVGPSARASQSAHGGQFRGWARRSAVD